MPRRRSRPLAVGPSKVGQAKRPTVVRNHSALWRAELESGGRDALTAAIYRVITHDPLDGNQVRRHLRHLEEGT